MQKSARAYKRRNRQLEQKQIISKCIKEIEPTLNNLPKQKAQRPGKFSGDWYNTFKEEIMIIVCHFFQKLETSGILPNLFYKANFTSISKSDTDIK